MPLLQAEEREALAEFSAHAAGRTAIVRAQADALIAYWETQADALTWERDARELTAKLNRLRLRLGEPEVTAPALPACVRLKPHAVVTGKETRPDAYRAAAARLRRALEASDKEIAKAWGVETKARTVAQNDLVALWPPRST